MDAIALGMNPVARELTRPADVLGRPGVPGSVGQERVTVMAGVEATGQVAEAVARHWND